MTYRSCIDFIRSIAASALLSALVLGISPAQAQPTTNLPTLSLNDAIDRALTVSPRLAASRASIAAAAGTRVQSGLLPNPEIGLNAENVAGTGAYSAFDNAELTVGASQLIELGGKRDARQAAAAANWRAARIDLDATQLELVREVTVAYVEAVTAEEQLRLTKDLEATARNVLADVSRRVDAAKDPLFQRSRAQVALTTATVARESAESALLAARQKLARYWGAPTVTEALDPATLFAVVEPEPLASYEARLTSAPDVLRYNELKAAREAELALAHAGAVPDVRASLGVRQFPGSSATALVLGVSLPIPVFNQNQGEIARAGAEITRTVSERRQAELERSQQLVDAWNQWKSAVAEATRLKASALPQADRAFKQALAGFQQGGFRYLDVLDAQRAFFDVKGALISALSRLQAARAQVERLTASATHSTPSEGTP